MTAAQNTTLSARLLAVLVMCGMLAVACASSTVAESTRGVDSASVETDDDDDGSADLAADEPKLTVVTDHEYGTTLDEWGDSGQPAVDNASPGHSTIAWDDLIPPGLSGAEIMAQYEDELNEVEYGTDEAEALWDEIEAAFDSNAINEDIDGQKIRLAGFVAPLSYDDEIVTEFLLVPTFGACIHVPPPPANQTVMVTVDKENGLTIEETWGPVWVEGTITVAFATTDLAEASYTITSARSGVHEA